MLWFISNNEFLFVRRYFISVNNLVRKCVVDCPSSSEKRCSVSGKCLHRPLSFALPFFYPPPSSHLLFSLSLIISLFMAAAARPFNPNDYPVVIGIDFGKGP